MNRQIIDLYSKGKESLFFQGKNREFHVMDKNLPRSPSYFVAYNQGNPFISDEVPKNFRNPMIFHELYEFESLQEVKTSRCLKTLQIELRSVDSSLMEDYIPFRRLTFRELINFHIKHNSDEKIISELRESFEYLKLIGRHSIL